MLQFFWKPAPVALVLLGLALGSGGAAPSAKAQVPCDLAALQVGKNSNCQIRVGELMRSFDVEVPSGLRERTPVVFDLHGFGGTKERQADRSGLERLVSQGEIVRVLPQGIGNSWNGGGAPGGANCCGQALGARIDDLRFFAETTEAVERALDIDPLVRVVSGISNGMAMTNRVFCAASDTFRITSGVSFQMPSDPVGCSPAPGAIYSELHGTDDRIVPFAGSDALNAGPADGVPARLAELHACNATPLLTRLNDNTTCQTFTGCQGDGIVQMCSVADGPHGLYPAIAEPDFAANLERLIEQATAGQELGAAR